MKPRVPIAANPELSPITPSSLRSRIRDEGCHSISQRRLSLLADSASLREQAWHAHKGLCLALKPILAHVT
ncbi:hypothetical protein NDU88_001215 [Pleurodeles waltl]|uniref:Uncharacterized protein n=1 Tax=Pleurodeles waltl TaxID=8319 RepID=A0AAV7VAR3_PLEWA|nr:hypothetical protein NDU88_001215 [Pleurodeles waltl]